MTAFNVGDRVRLVHSQCPEVDAEIGLVAGSEGIIQRIDTRYFSYPIYDVQFDGLHEDDGSPLVVGNIRIEELELIELETSDTSK